MIPKLEDDAVNRAVHVVFTGQLVIGALQPGVVLLDIGMPGMDGYEVARKIRQQASSRNIALVALTGWGQD